MKNTILTKGNENLEGKGTSRKLVVPAEASLDFLDLLRHRKGNTRCGVNPTKDNIVMRKNKIV